MNGQGLFDHKGVYSYKGVWKNGHPEGDGV